MLIAVVLQDYLKIKYVNVQESPIAITQADGQMLSPNITVLVLYMIVNVSMNRKLMNIEKLLITKNSQVTIGIDLKNRLILNVNDIKPNPASYCRSLSFQKFLLL